MTELSWPPTFRGYSTIISSYESKLLTSHARDNAVTGLSEEQARTVAVNEQGAEGTSAVTSWQ